MNILLLPIDDEHKLRRTDEGVQSELVRLFVLQADIALYSVDQPEIFIDLLACIIVVISDHHSGGKIVQLRDDVVVQVCTDFLSSTELAGASANNTNAIRRLTVV